MNNIPYGRQQITAEDISAVVETLKSDYLTQGPKIKEFENKFSKYINAKYAVAVSNGTTALHLAAKVLGVKPGQRIITTPLSFVATANCIKYCNAEVEFVDIDPKTLVIDIDKVKRLLQSHPMGTFAGIIPVDFAGYPVNMESLRSLANEYNLWIIEDACHSPGAAFLDENNTWQQCGNGNFADLSIFSFHPVKHIACGEGGMITTNDPKLYEALRILRTHGITKDPAKLENNPGNWHYEMQTLGFNYRLPDISCALGISQLKRAKIGVERRVYLAKRYDEAFKNSAICIQQIPSNIRHAYHLYVIQVSDRKGLYDFLKRNGIHAQVHYQPIHLMPYYKSFGWKKGDMPAAESYYNKCLSIPLYPTLKEREQDLIINLIKEYIYEKTSNNTSTWRQQKIAS